MHHIKRSDFPAAEEMALLARLERSSQRYRRSLDDFYARRADINFRELATAVEMAEFEFEIAHRAVLNLRQAA